MADLNEEKSEDKQYLTRSEVESHSNPNDLWVVINNSVYNLTKFIDSHPGGKKVIIKEGGRDATSPWKLAGHSPKAIQQMNNYLVGQIKPEENIVTEEPKQNEFSNMFPYISGLLFFVLLYFFIFNTDLHLEKPSDIYGLVLGVLPSLFLILTGLKLWPGRVFRIHRIGGLCFLIQYSFSWYYFFTDYQWFKNSSLVWTLLLNGCAQAISAIIEIGPTLNPHDRGEYFGTKQETISRDFVIENLFYQLITAFSSLYYYPQYFALIRSNYLGRVIEIVFVFLPYLVLRPLFPKTSLRNAVKKDSVIITEDTRLFIFLSTWAIRIILLFGKHYIGYFTNTVRFLGYLNSPEEEKLLHFMMLANAGAVSISVFLHTLKFKNKLSPKVSLSIYLMFVYTPVIAIFQLAPRLFMFWKLFILFTVGLFINFTPKYINHTWSVLIAAWFVAYQSGMLPDAQNYII